MRMHRRALTELMFFLLPLAQTQWGAADRDTTPVGATLLLHRRSHPCALRLRTFLH